MKRSRAANLQSTQDDLELSNQQQGNPQTHHNTLQAKDENISEQANTISTATSSPKRRLLARSLRRRLVDNQIDSDAPSDLEQIQSIQGPSNDPEDDQLNDQSLQESNDCSLKIVKNYVAESEKPACSLMKFQEIQNITKNEDTEINHHLMDTIEYSESFIWLQEKEQALLKAQLTFKKAQKYYRVGDYFDCLLKLEKAMESYDPQIFCYELQNQSTLVYHHMLDCMIQSASCYSHLKQYEQALKLLDTILPVEPNNIKVLYLKGCVFERQKLWKLAYANFTRANEICPNNNLILQHLSKAKNSLGIVDDQILIDKKNEEGKVSFKQGSSPSSKESNGRVQSAKLSNNTGQPNSSDVEKIDCDSYVQNETSIKNKYAFAIQWIKKLQNWVYQWSSWLKRQQTSVKIVVYSLIVCVVAKVFKYLSNYHKQQIVAFLSYMYQSFQTMVPAVCFLKHLKE